MTPVRNLVIVLGDQLNHDSAAFEGFDERRDVVWMAEVARESTHVPSHKVRIALFLSAMRHFAAELRQRGIRVEYRELEDAENRGSLGSELGAAVERLRPECVVMVEAGDYRVQQEILAAVPEMEVREDRHFYCSRRKFAGWARGHKQLRMEFFYREMRRKTGVLMNDDEPEGGRWNYDAENRKSFGKQGPVTRAPRRFELDEITRGVMALVEKRFAKHVGSLQHFALPVTAKQAGQALDDFLQHRLARFGDYQDALWTGEAFLYHSTLSAAMNLKLLNPRTVVEAVEKAYRRGDAELAAAEGFIRQILGWRSMCAGSIGCRCRVM